MRYVLSGYSYYHLNRYALSGLFVDGHKVTSLRSIMNTADATITVPLTMVPAAAADAIALIRAFLTSHHMGGAILSDVTTVAIPAPAVHYRRLKGLITSLPRRKFSVPRFPIGTLYVIGGKGNLVWN